MELSVYQNSNLSSNFNFNFISQTGWIHALIATPLALRLILFPSPSLVEDPIFGYAPLEGAVYAFSFGYFLYDFIVSVYFIKSRECSYFLYDFKSFWLNFS